MDEVASLVAYKSHKRPVVRAAKRKLDRKKSREERKKRRKPVHQVAQHVAVEEERPVVKTIKKKTEKKSKKSKKKVSFSDEVPAFLAETEKNNPDQLELEYLEKKLKIKRSKNGIDKVARELSQDGFGDEIGDFLLELESGFAGEAAGAASNDFADAERDMYDLPTDESGTDVDESSSENEEDDASSGEDNVPGNSASAANRPKTPEELELEYLEKKLKLGGSKSKKSKVLKELKQDGIGSDLSGILVGKSIAEPSDAENSDSNSDDEEEEGETSMYFKRIGATGESEQFEELDPSDPNMVVMPSKDLYGRDSKPDETEKPRDGPRFRFKPKPSAASSGGLDSSAIEALGPNAPRLRMRLNGLLNRLTDANVSPICTSIIQYYDENSNRVMNTLISDLVLAACSDKSKVMTSLVTVLACLVAGLNISIGTEVGAFIVEASVKRFELVHENLLKEKNKDEGDAGNDQDLVSNKSSCNLALFIALLHIFGVINDKLVLDLMLRLADRLEPVDVSVIDVLLDQVGFLLRNSNPGEFKTLFMRIAEKGSASRKNKGITSYLLDSITALKNNKQEAKQRHERNKESRQRLLTWIRHQRTNSANSVIPLQLGWQEVLDADTRGRWWVVGGVWSGNRDSARGESEKSSKTMISGSGGTVTGVLASADARLLKGAKKRRLTTDVRKAVFCVLMSGSDYLETFDNLLKLNLRDRQERDIVTVLLICCRDSKKYNPYFSLVATKLCEYKNAFKFTFQLQFWDTFKIVHELKDTKVSNLAMLMCDLTMHFSLSLAILKVIEFTKLNKSMVLFLNTFFLRIFEGGTREGREADESVVQVFRRLAESKDAEFVRDGIVVFFRTHFDVDNCTNPKLVFRRVQIAVSLLEDIGGENASDAQEDDDAGF